MDLAQWTAWKRDLVGITDLDRDALHIYIGVGIQIAAAMLARRKLGDWLPWLVVLIVACLGEVADVNADWWPSPVMQIGKSVHDLVNTMIMPSLLMIASRRWPTLFGRS